MARLRTRYYRALPIDAPGYEEEWVDLDPAGTALVVMHCWNIGCPDGPAVDTAFCVGMGWPQATAEAERIMRETIRPAMEAARASQVQVVHVESDWMDHQYPQIESRRQAGSTVFPGGQLGAQLARAHGREYLTRSPLAHMRRAAAVAPEGDEALFFYSDRLDEHLRQAGVSLLVYAGFAADMCVLGAEGGARAMLARGYRCVLLRDATVGVETPETFPSRLATRYGVHRFEWQVGNSATSGDFAAALREGG